MYIVICTKHSCQHSTTLSTQRGRAETMMGDSDII